MIHLSSYHSNGLPPVVWPNKVNLIGEKVYKPKIHFCESCNKPILIYGRLIPCKHVFCFTCASMCLPNAQLNGNGELSPTSAHIYQSTNSSSTSCHRCGGRTLRVERNTLNSIFVCQIDSCKRTYLSARDLQAHVTHRHSKNKQQPSNQASNSSASQVAISSSPYISSSTLLHMNGHNQGGSKQRQTSSSNSNITNNHTGKNPSGSPGSYTRHRRDRESHHHHHPPHHGAGGSGGGRNRDRCIRDRDEYKRERDNKEHFKQSLQRAAQWAEASAQSLEKGLTSR